MNNELKVAFSSEDKVQRVHCTIGDFMVEYVKEVEADNVVLLARVERAEEMYKHLRSDRDLAIAHDRQPYPTVEAYEKVCKVLHKREAELVNAREMVDVVEEMLEMVRENVSRVFYVEAALTKIATWKEGLQ